MRGIFLNWKLPRILPDAAIFSTRQRSYLFLFDHGRGHLCRAAGRSAGERAHGLPAVTAAGGRGAPRHAPVRTAVHTRGAAMCMRHGHRDEREKSEPRSSVTVSVRAACPPRPEAISVQPEGSARQCDTETDRRATAAAAAATAAAAAAAAFGRLAPHENSHHLAGTRARLRGG